MNLVVRNLSSVSTAIEIYALDPASTSDSPVLPTYFVPIETGDHDARTVPWPRVEEYGALTLFAATNDGGGPQNVTEHTPTGASAVQVRLTGDGTTFVFVG